MEETIEAQCRRLVDHIYSLAILDLIACFIFFMIMRRSQNNLQNLFSLVRALPLQFLLSYLLDKVCPKYITLILSYVYISICKCVLQLFLKRKYILQLFLKNTSILQLFLKILSLKRSLQLPYFGLSPLQFTLLCSIIFNYSILNLDKFNPKKYPYLYCFLINPLSDRPCYDAPREEQPEETELKGATSIKDVRINRDEVMLAMEIICENTTKGGDQIENCMGYEEFSGLFQESEPRLDEVKEAFSVFDQNRDGLVDARDLQRVLNNLGVRYGANLDACERMIEQHDRNKDRNVDLADFSRLLEMSLLGNGD